MATDRLSAVLRRWRTTSIQIAQPDRHDPSQDINATSEVNSMNALS